MSIAGPPERFGGPVATSAEMARIYIPAQGIADWQSLLADPVRQWRAGYSAMAAAQSWQCAAGLPPEIDALLGGGTELQLAIPEHKVPLPGRGADSQCDVFALVQAGAQGVGHGVALFRPVQCNALHAFGGIIQLNHLKCLKCLNWLRTA